MSLATLHSLQVLRTGRRYTHIPLQTPKKVEERANTQYLNLSGPIKMHSKIYDLPSCEQIFQAITVKSMYTCTANIYCNV